MMESNVPVVCHTRIYIVPNAVMHIIHHIHFIDTSLALHRTTSLAHHTHSYSFWCLLYVLENSKSDLLIGAWI